MCECESVSGQSIIEVTICISSQNQSQRPISKWCHNTKNNNKELFGNGIIIFKFINKTLNMFHPIAHFILRWCL